MRQLVTCFLIMLCSLSNQTMAQKHLSKKVDVNFNEVPLEDALEELEEKGSFQFSYNSYIIDIHEHPVSYRSNNAEVKVVLKDIIPKKVKLIELGSYVVIRDARKGRREKLSLSGQVYDSKTNRPISDVTVYAVESLEADLSSGDGSYKVDFKEDRSTVQIAISKSNYRDTIIQVQRDYTGPINVHLEPLLDSAMFDAENSRADSLRFVQLMAGKKSIEHMRNVQFFQEKYGQVSFLPLLGTNKQFGGKTRNHFSLNVLAGYNHSLTGLEVGGFANIERYDVKGAQIAGFTNIVGRETKGFQASGFVNVNKRKIQGMQLAGFVNVAVDTLFGFQAAGFTNVGPYTKGVQLSGFVNTTWAGSKAYQFAGFVNYTKSNSGAQLAGFLNFSLKKHTGMQAAGFVNYAGSSSGVQVAGFANFSVGTTEGVQIAGLLNYSTRLKGVQIGVLNICDTIESGLAIGALTFVRKGVFEPEIYASDFSPYNFRFKTGAEPFYNIIGAGYEPNEEIYSIGYGLGTRVTYPTGIIRGFEIQANALRKDFDGNWEQTNLLNTVYPFLGYRFAKHLSLSGGPVLNIYVTDLIGTNGEYGYPVLNNPFYDQTNNGMNVKMSIGYRVGLAF